MLFVTRRDVTELSAFTIPAVPCFDSPFVSTANPCQSCAKDSPVRSDYYLVISILRAQEGDSEVCPVTKLTNLDSSTTV